MFYLYEQLMGNLYQILKLQNCAVLCSFNKLYSIISLSCMADYLFSWHSAKIEWCNQTDNLQSAFNDFWVFMLVDECRKTHCSLLDFCTAGSSHHQLIHNMYTEHYHLSSISIFCLLESCDYFSGNKTCSQLRKGLDWPLHWHQANGSTDFE